MTKDLITLELEERAIVGKKVKHLRTEGLTPAVIHDHGKPSLHVTGKSTEILKAFRSAGKNHTIELKLGGKNFTALIKTAEFEPRKHQLVHVVFGAVDVNEKVTADIPVHLSEDIPAEKSSLIVIHQLESVLVESIPSKLPDQLTVDASGLVEIGDKLTVADIVVPDGVIILTEPDHAVATVYEPSALAAANDAAGGDAEEETAEETSEEGAEATGEEAPAAESTDDQKSAE